MLENAWNYDEIANDLISLALVSIKLSLKFPSIYVIMHAMGEAARNNQSI